MKNQWCEQCQSITNWVRIGQTDPIGNGWLVLPIRRDLFQCKKCGKVKSCEERKKMGWGQT